MKGALMAKYTELAEDILKHVGGKENVKLDMHHVRKLKNLQGKEDWEKHMIARKRKTIALCRSCHKKVDGGWMD
jgi:hypothetical protein